MPELDIVDSTWIGAKPARVATAVADATNWPTWWPGLELAVLEARGPEGMRWTVRTGPNATAGEMEIWLEPAFDGTVLHCVLRLDATAGRPLGRRRRERIATDYRRQAKRAFWALGDELDAGRVSRMTASR
jgi:hypothetical protein